MLAGFICPDGEQVKLEDCLASCRLGERCMTLPSLTIISREREWNGKPSTTQLLEGTMLSFLKLTNSYYVDPDSRTFMLSGTKHHQQLDEVAKELGLAAEIPLSTDRDIFDLLEWEGKELVLTDYKLWGSFRVAKALGIVEIGKQPGGEVYKTNSKYGRAGSPKMVPLWGVDIAKIDNWEAEYQLNRYRVMLKQLGITINKLQLQVTVRDGGLYIAKDRGVFRNSYKIHIPILSDSLVIDYFSAKETDLLLALKQGHWDLPCTTKESWDGARCEGFCDIWNYCSKGQLVHKIGRKDGSK